MIPRRLGQPARLTTSTPARSGARPRGAARRHAAAEDL